MKFELFLFLCLFILKNVELTKIGKKSRLDVVALSHDDKLVSKNARFYAMVLLDGNFGLFSKGGTNGRLNDDTIWVSGTNGMGHGPYQLSILDEGDLILTDKDNTVLWNTQTAGKGIGPFRLEVTDYGKLVLADSHEIILWSSYFI
jgi:hypothetical protein